MAKDDKDKTADTPAKRSKKKLFMIIGLAVVLLGGGAGGYLMFKPTGAEAEPEPVPGIVVVLEATTINLADGHYLKLKMTLQATDAAHEEPDGSKAIDIAIALFSNMDSAELLTTEGREKHKVALTEKVIEAYEHDGEKAIMDIYFTTFVIQ